MIIHGHFLRALCWLLFTLLPAGIVRAEDSTTKTPDTPVSGANFQVHGFLTQGLFYTNKNNYFGDSTHGSLDFTEIGLGATAQINENVRLSGSVISRTAGETDDDYVKIDHLVADFTKSFGQKGLIGITLGRIKLPFGLYNDSRDVASTRPSILLPQSVYFDQNRPFLINADGMFAYYDHNDDGGNYTRVGYMAAVTPNVNRPESKAYFFGFKAPGELRLSGVPQALRLYHTRNEGHTTFTAWYSEQKYEYLPTASDFLPRGELNNSTVWASARHEMGKWGVTSEIFINRSRYRGFSPIIADSNLLPAGGYVQVDYRPNQAWEIFGRYDLSYSNWYDKSGTKLAATSGKPAYSFYAKDFTVGARYHIDTNNSISAEIHNVTGTSWLPISDNPAGSNIEKDWKIFALQYSYRF